MAEDVQISGIFVKAEDVQISGIFVSRCFCLIAGEIKTIGGGIRVPWTLFLVNLSFQKGIRKEKYILCL